MSLGGEMIYSTQDADGEMRVFDDGISRTLSFGPGNEQSAVLKATPAQPLFEYIQVMLMALLFHRPRRVLCLGLGAGSLITTLHAHFDDASFTAVELRRIVLEAALRYFYLPVSPRVRLYCQDAGDFLASQPEAAAPYDLIFSDLYGELGLDPLQLEADFLEATAQRLTSDGLLVINCWYEHQRDPQLLLHLRASFGHLRLCPTGDGNWVIFASNRAFETRPAVLKTSAELWSSRLGCSLLRHLKQLKPS